MNKSQICPDSLSAMLLREIAKEMKTIREKLGLTQNEFAQALLLNRATLANFEYGRAYWRPSDVVNVSANLEVFIAAKHAHELAVLERIRVGWLEKTMRDVVKIETEKKEGLPTSEISNRKS